MTFSGENFFFLKKEEQTEGEKTRGKIQDFNRHSKKNYPPHTHAFITCTTSTHTNNGAENLKNGFLLCMLQYFVCIFSETKCKWPKKKKTGECFTTKLKSTCKNSGTFEEMK